MTEWILTSSVLILVIFGLRFLLRGKISPLIQYCLWGLVLLRLLVPFSITESVISVSNLLRQPVLQTAESDIRHYENIYDQIAAQHTHSGNTPAPAQIRQEALDRIYADTYRNLSDRYSQSGSSVSDLQIRTEARQQVDLIGFTAMVPEALPYIWYSGMAVVGCALLLSNLHFAQRLRKNRKRMDAPDIPLPVYETNIAATPCLFGLFRPVIYLTGEAANNSGMRRHILIHELTHYRHRDHIWSLLRGICLMLHWYNPLVWVAAILSKQDGELACDEAAIRALGEQERTAYGRTLIGMTCIRRDAQSLLITATTMVGSKKTLKERITRIAQKPKTALYTLIACILVASLAVGCTFTGSLTPGLTKDQVWEKVLAAVEAYNNRDHYHITVDSAYEFGDDTPDGSLTNEFYQANGNEVRRFHSGDHTEIVLLYSGNLYVAVEGSEWHDFENSAHLTDLSFQIPAEENLVLSCSQEGDQLVVVCDYSYQEPDEHAQVDPTVTFWINSDGDLDQYAYTYGVDTQNSSDYILTVTVTVHVDDAAAVNRKILNTYNEVAAALGLPLADFSHDEIYEKLKATVQEINSRESYHFKLYLTIDHPGEQDPTGNENFTQGWISGADMYVEQAYWGPVTPNFVRYNGVIYSHIRDNLWLQPTDSTTDTDTYRIELPSRKDYTMAWSETEGYLDIFFVENDDPSSGVLFRLDPAGQLVWYAPYMQGMLTNQESGEAYNAPVYSVLIYPDMDADAIRQHLDTVVPPLIASMEEYTFPTESTEP